MMELRNIRLEVGNILQSYNVNNTEKITIIKKWLGRQGLQFTETLTQAKQELCNTVHGLFHTLKINCTCNIMKWQNPSNIANWIDKVVPEKWMGRLRIAVAEYNYKELDRQLKEIIHELTTMTETSAVTSEQMLAWARWVEVWWSQSAVLDSLKQIKGFDTIKSERVEQKSNKTNTKNTRTKEALQAPWLWMPSLAYLAYRKTCRICRKNNHFKMMCRNNKSRRDVENEKKTW